MISRRRLNHTAAGLLGKFVGRNNDLEGYWALGVLHTVARAAGRPVELDLLGGTAQPESPACIRVAQGFMVCLCEAITRHGASVEDLALARIVIAFDQQSIPAGPGIAWYGEAFLCSLHLVSNDGRESIRIATGRCKPHREFPGSRSTRYLA